VLLQPFQAQFSSSIVIMGRFIFFRVHYYLQRRFPSLPLSQKIMSCVAASRLSCLSYKLIVFIALKNPFLVDYLMFVVCMVAIVIDPNLMVIRYF